MLYLSIISCSILSNCLNIKDSSKCRNILKTIVGNFLVHNDTLSILQKYNVTHGLNKVNKVGIQQTFNNKRKWLLKGIGNGFL